MRRKVSIVIESVENGFVVSHPTEYKMTHEGNLLVFSDYEGLTKWLYDHFNGSAKTDIPV